MKKSSIFWRLQIWTCFVIKVLSEIKIWVNCHYQYSFCKKIMSARSILTNFQFFLIPNLHIYVMLYNLVLSSLCPTDFWKLLGDMNMIRTRAKIVPDMLQHKWEWILLISVFMWPGCIWFLCILFPLPLWLVSIWKHGSKCEGLQVRH